MTNYDVCTSKVKTIFLSFKPSWGWVKLGAVFEKRVRYWLDGSPSANFSTWRTLKTFFLFYWSKKDNSIKLLTTYYIMHFLLSYIFLTSRWNKDHTPWRRGGLGRSCGTSADWDNSAGFVSKTFYSLWQCFSPSRSLNEWLRVALFLVASCHRKRDKRRFNQGNHAMPWHMRPRRATPRYAVPYLPS